MNAVELLLIDLVQIAETPLYSAYRWLAGRLGRELPLGGFLRLIDELIARDVLRLWEVDHRSHDRTELFGVPYGLEDRYGSIEDLDGNFDPFGFSLTLGTAADVDAEPTWEVDFDFERRRFELLVGLGTTAHDAIKQVGRYYPDIALVPEQRDQVGERVRVVGRIEPV